MTTQDTPSTGQTDNTQSRGTSQAHSLPVSRALLNLVILILVLGVFSTLLWGRISQDDTKTANVQITPRAESFQEAVNRIDQSLARTWQDADIAPVETADDLTIARRLSLALTGTIPSLEEIRTFETQPDEQRIQWWLTRIFEDRRWSDYVAERFARAYVGADGGPFLVYRRRRMVDWISDRLMENQPYDQLVRTIITADGIWTSNPEVNFVTVTIDQNNDENGPSEIKLAGRVSRAFLGIRIDCMECHNDKFGDRWKQTDFHQLAAFFGETEVSFNGIRDDEKNIYKYRYLGKKEAQEIPAIVPFHPELLPETGSPRGRLAQWVTHRENRPFARSTVNRLWALLFNKPLVEPIDDIPLDGPWPETMEILADELIACNYDLQHMIRLISATRAFQLDSRSNDHSKPVTPAHELYWAAFPVTRMRPEQVASSVIQASSITTVDTHSHIIQRLMRITQQSDFIKRYGDPGEDEFEEMGGTIPQRLLLMNGNLVQERTKENPIMNASSRIGILSPDDESAVETAYLAIFTRRPTEKEGKYFTEMLSDKKASQRSQAMTDIYWTLMNATEFSWNH